MWLCFQQGLLLSVRRILGIETIHCTDRLEWLYHIEGPRSRLINQRKTRLTKEYGKGRMIYPKWNLWMGLLFCGTVSNLAFAQGPPPVVIEGGTLIDGNGGTPI